MNVFLKMIAGTFMAIILWIFLSKENKSISVLLSLAVCSVVLTAGILFLQPVLDFVEEIRLIGNIDSDLLKIMLKVIGIGLLAEFSTLICKDAGNEAMGKSVQIVAVIFIMRISIPVFEIMLTLLDEILGSI